MKDMTETSAVVIFLFGGLAFHPIKLFVLKNVGASIFYLARSGFAHINRSLSKIFRDIERARDKVGEGRSNDLDAIAESNVRLQIRLIMDNSMTITDAVNKGQLSVAGDVYSVATGLVRFI